MLPVDMDPERRDAEAQAGALEQEAQEAKLDAIQRQNETDAIEQQAEAQIDAIERQAEASEARQTEAAETRQGDRDDRDAADDVYLARIHVLESELRHLKLMALQPQHGFLRLLIKDLETNPHAQYKVHRYGLYYWLINFPAVTLLFFLEPAIWLKTGIFITLVYSIYANFATEYSGMSAAMAAYEDKFMPPIPLSSFVGGRGGTGGSGGAGGAGGSGGGNGKSGEPGESGEPGKLGELPDQDSR